MGDAELGAESDHNPGRAGAPASQGVVPQDEKSATGVVAATPSIHRLICPVRQMQRDESRRRSKWEVQLVNEEQRRTGRTQMFLCHSSGKEWG